jgi:hypothetical protein
MDGSRAWGHRRGKDEEGEGRRVEGKCGEQVMTGDGVCAK